jgi:hypothetical protein
MKTMEKKIWTYEQVDEIPEHSIVLNGKEVEISTASVKHGRWVFEEEIDIEEKINYYSSIGIKKQIWVLLSKREVIVIEDNKRSIYSFDDEIELLEGRKIKFSDVEKEVIS